MPRPDGKSVIDLIAPPAGYRFHAGVWLCHDLDWRVLAEQVAPALANVVTTGERRLAETNAAVDADAPGLVVLHAGGSRFAAGGPAVHWIRERPVPGRRQHAKVAVLHYVWPGGTKRRVKAIVMSGNLTRGGVSSNIEVLTWDEHGAGSAPSIGVDLVREVRDLASGLPPFPRLDLVVRELRRHLSGVPRTGHIRSSLNREAPMVRPPRRGEQLAQRITIVTPAFAGKTDTKAARALAPWCETGTKVDIYLGFDGSREQAQATNAGLVVSLGLLDGLRRAGAEVALHAVPQREADGSYQRLHAKLVAIHPVKGTPLVLTGSANCTGPGLNGQNREVMVQQRRSAAWLRSFISQLDSVEHGGELLDPEPRTIAASEPITAIVAAVFEIDPGATPDAGSWRGVLTVTLIEGPESTTVTYAGQRVPVGGSVAIVMDADRAVVEVRARGRTQLAQVEVVAPPGSEGFWSRLTPELRIDHPDRELERLLGDVDRATTGTGTDTGTSHQVATDGFSIPLSQRLVVIARHRRSIATRSTEDMETLLDTYLDTRTANEKEDRARNDELRASRITALAIHAAYNPEAPPPASRLLRRLRAAIRVLDDETDD